MAARGLSLLPRRCSFHRCGTLQAKKSNNKKSFLESDHCLDLSSVSKTTLLFPFIISNDWHLFLLWVSVLNGGAFSWVPTSRWAKKSQLKLPLSRSEAKAESTVIPQVHFPALSASCMYLFQSRSDWLRELCTFLMIGQNKYWLDLRFDWLKNLKQHS